MTTYSTDHGIRWSVLKHMQRSPAHYRYALENDTQPRTDAMILGTVTHYAVFQPHLLDTHVAVWEGRRAGKEWERFEAENSSKEIIKADQYELALQIGASARAAAGRGLSDGQSEVELFWTHKNGLPGKARLDHISRGFGIWDLKTTKDAAPLAFGRQAASMLYHVQASEYVDAAEANGYGVLPYTLLAVESKAPFAAALYTVTEDHLELGRSIYLPLLDRVKECQERGEWPAYPAGVLSLPKWAEPAIGADDQDVSEFFPKEEG